MVGKRVGRYKWSPTTPKTLEGSAGFTLSVVAFAWALRVFGLVEDFSVSLECINLVARPADLCGKFSIRLCDTGRLLDLGRY